jgi:hypothetical protein
MARIHGSSLARPRSRGRRSAVFIKRSSARCRTGGRSIGIPGGCGGWPATTIYPGVSDSNYLMMQRQGVTHTASSPFSAVSSVRKQPRAVSGKLQPDQPENPSIRALRLRIWVTYAGKVLIASDAEWARWEEEIIAAGREGRIAGALDIHGR